MSTVKIGVSRQVVIPKKIHDQLGLTPGDYFDVELQNGKIIFTPKTLVDKRIEEGLEDIRQGQVYGPFNSAQEMIDSLHDSPKSKNKTKKG